MPDHSKPPEFGKRNRPERAQRPAPPMEPVPARKRSAAITLAVIGAGTVGLLALANSTQCRPGDPNQPQAGCQSSSRSGSYYFGNSSSPSSTSTVARGGFGKTGAAISSHAGS